MQPFKARFWNPIAVATLTLGICILGSTSHAQANTFYVGPDGRNWEDGTAGVRTLATAQNSSTPWKTIAHAIEQIRTRTVDDVIIVKDGTYTEQVRFTRSNLAIRAANDGNQTRPVIVPTNNPSAVPALDIWEGVFIDGRSNIEVSGFDLRGGSANSNCSGIVIQGGSRYVTISNNIVSNFGGCGIASVNRANGNSDPGGAPGGCDFIFVRDNTVRGCCKNSYWATSAISMHGNSPQAVDPKPASYPTSGWHVILERNTIYDNYANYTLPDAYGNNWYTDANGIIVDLQGTVGPLTLIQNNIIYKNGGRGIHIFKSSNVRVYNNTIYKNCQSPDMNGSSTGNRPGQVSGELSVGYGGNVIFCNNLVYTYGSVKGNTNNNLTGSLSFISNSYYAGGSWNVPTDMQGTNNTYNQDPKFEAPDAATPNFKCKAGGAGIDTGSSSNAASYDFSNVARPQGGSYDRGAYEQSGSALSALASSTTGI